MRIAWLAIILSSAAVATPASAPTPQSIRQGIAAHGASRTIDDLQKKGQWETVTDFMDAGRPEWIALAPLLAPGSDAGSAEDLGISLAFALPRNPASVLAALDGHNGHVLGVDRVCGRPFIEDTEPRDYKKGAMTALASVRTPGLLPRKQACLKVLAATR